MYHTTNYLGATILLESERAGIKVLSVRQQCVTGSDLRDIASFLNAESYGLDYEAALEMDAEFDTAAGTKFTAADCWSGKKYMPNVNYPTPVRTFIQVFMGPLLAVDTNFRICKQWKDADEAAEFLNFGHYIKVAS